MTRSYISLLAAFGLLLGVSAAHGLESDRNEPIQIEADQAEADDARKMTVYRGRVVITQGTLRIRGDVVTIFFDENNTISRLIAERVSDTDAEPQGESADLRAAGDLADFRQRTEENEEFHNAKADRMEWFAEKNKIVLLGNAESWQGENRIQADRIVYDTLNGRVLADTRVADDGESEAAETKASQRVRITITPNNE